MNHRRLINSLIPAQIVVPMLTHRFNEYKRTNLTIIHPETTQRTINLQGITWLQKSDFTIQNFYKSYNVRLIV